MTKQQLINELRAVAVATRRRYRQEECGVGAKPGTAAFGKQAAGRLGKIRQAQKDTGEFKPSAAAVYGPRGYKVKPKKGSQ